MQTDRLNIRISRGEKTFLRQAARLERQTISAFVLTAAFDRAVVVHIAQPAPGRAKTQGKKR